MKRIINKVKKVITGKKKYRCHICGRLIHQSCSLEHAKAEEYLLSLIKKDHPKWRQGDPTCPECIDYYRKLIDQAEI